MRSSFRNVWVGLFGLGIASFFGGAEAAPDDAKDQSVLQLVDYLDFEQVGSPQIRPDGREILFERRRVDKMNDRRRSSIWVMDADGDRMRELMGTGSGAIWSLDGSKIAFVKSDDNKRPQIFTRYMDDEGLVTQVTSFEYAPRSMAWSPDGQYIAFVARVPLKPTWTVSLPGKPKGAKWTADPAIIDTLHYRQDRVGLTNTGYDHLFVVPATGGTPRQLTDGEWNVGARIIGAIATAPSLSWSPDGKRILFDGPAKAPTPPHYFESHINAVDVDTGEITTLTSGTGTYGGGTYSPDGSKIAFTGYPDHNTSYPVPKLYIMNADGTGQRTVLDDLADGPSDVTWSSSGRTLFFTMNDRGYRHIYQTSLGGNVQALTSGQQVFSFGTLAKNNTAAMVVSRPTMPGAVATVDLGQRRPQVEVLTDVNADVFHGKTLGRVEEIWYDAVAETGEAARVQGWLVFPPDYSPAEKYPLLLSIHGGPHAMYNGGFNFTFQEFAARGYVVLYTNPRGSTGYGSEFANAIRHRYPGPVDYADLMAGVDLAVERGIADPDRLFVTGCSGGGVLTTWVIAQTDRFKAAAALCPVVNWIGMSGTTDVVAWLYNFFPKPFWEDPTAWLEHSTIMHVGKVSTPTLLMTGVKDLRTPLGEAEEYYAALKLRGVPTKLIPMEEEYHGTRSKPSNYLRTSLMLRKWFDEFDPAKLEKEDVE